MENSGVILKTFDLDISRISPKNIITEPSTTRPKFLRKSASQKLRMPIKTFETSTSSDAYKYIPPIYASMRKKPLTPYHPLSFRSRLNTEKLQAKFNPYASSIKFIDFAPGEKRRVFDTEYRRSISSSKILPSLTARDFLNKKALSKVF